MIKINLTYPDGAIKEFNFDKDKIIIGSDSKCDLIIKDESISKEHILLHSSGNNLYLQNKSLFSDLFKNKKLIEQANVEENDIIKFNGYELSASIEKKSIVQLKNVPVAKILPIETNNDDVINSQIDNKLDSEININENQFTEDFKKFSNNSSALIDYKTANEFISEKPLTESFMKSKLIEPVTNPSSNLEYTEDELDKSFAPLDLGTEAKTQITNGNEPSLGKLIIIKGSSKFNSIDLETKDSSWTIGKDSSCNINFEDTKIPDFAFKIFRESNKFYLELIDNSEEVLINDSIINETKELRDSDLIKCGSLFLEFQTDSSESNTNFTNVFNDKDQPDESANIKKTKTFNLATLDDESASDDHNLYNDFKQQAPPIYDEEAEEEKTTNKKFNFKKFNLKNIDKKNLKRIAMYGILFLIGGYFFLNSDSSNKKKISTTKKSSEKIQISKKSNAEINTKLEKFYVETNTNLEKNNLEMALKNAGDLINLLQENELDDYKGIKQLAADIQFKINENELGAIQSDEKTKNEIEQEATANIEIFLRNAKKELLAENWDTAADWYSKALNLDPQNIEANEGINMAINKVNPNDFIENKEKLAQLNKNKEEKEEEKPKEKTKDEILVEKTKDKINALEIQYDFFKKKFNEGDFISAINGYKEIEQKLSSLNTDGFSNSRFPASTQDSINSKVNSLYSNIKLGKQNSIEQLNLKYSDQLEDARQFYKNGKLNNAKQILDTIIKDNPYYEDAIYVRDNLFNKIIDQAKKSYRSAILDESIGRIEQATQAFLETLELLANVDHPTARKYYANAFKRLRRLNP